MMNSFGMKLRRLSGSDLKLIAAITMLIDHIACYLLFYVAGWVNDTCFLNLTYYDVLRGIGRIAMPIYCFLLIEGFEHTHDIKKYLGRLTFLAVITEPIWDVSHTGIWYTPYTQSVMVTLTLGLLCLICIRWAENLDAERTSQWMIMLLETLAFAYIAERLHCDYGAIGILVIVTMYLLRDSRFWVLRMIICVYLFHEWWHIIPYLLLQLYDGTRGFIKNRFMQWLFYFWYPLHLWILYFIRLSFG